MKRAVLIIGKNVNLNNYDFSNSYVIGVDKGAYLAYLNNIKLDCAIGDFDSIGIDEYQKLCNYTKVIKLNPVKDETDTLEALKLVIDYDEIVLLGSIQGKRIEHFYSNLLLLKENEHVVMLDDYSYIYSSSKSFNIKKNKYKYISLYSLVSESNISLEGFKYNLSNYSLKEIDHLCISNEITSSIAKVSVNAGRILVVLSMGDNDEEVL